jgi:hypothetical protein
MSTGRRCIGVVAATLGVAAGLTIGTSDTAYAATVTGKSCGEKHPMAPEYYDAAGNAAPCTAEFTAATSGTARITIDVIPHPGERRNDPHNWSFDVHTCTGTVLPDEPPRTFTCDFEPGAHTVYADMSSGGDKFVDLKVTY